VFLDTFSSFAIDRVPIPPFFLLMFLIVTQSSTLTTFLSSHPHLMG
jgi:hypothetical protein